MNDYIIILNYQYITNGYNKVELITTENNNGLTCNITNAVMNDNRFRHLIKARYISNNYFKTQKHNFKDIIKLLNEVYKVNVLINECNI